jgi:ubiquinone biosynthesis protein
MGMADINLGAVVTEFVDMLNRFGVSVPASLTMLGRSLLVIQGMLAGVSPDTNVMEIVADYIKAAASGPDAIEAKAKSVMKQLLASGDRLTMLPEQASDLIRKAGSGQLTGECAQFLLRERI